MSVMMKITPKAKPNQISYVQKDAVISVEEIVPETDTTAPYCILLLTSGVAWEVLDKIEDLIEQLED